MSVGEACLYGYGLYGYGLYRYGLYSYGLYARKMDERIGAVRQRQDRPLLFTASR